MRRLPTPDPLPQRHPVLAPFPFSAVVERLATLSNLATQEALARFGRPNDLAVVPPTPAVACKGSHAPTLPHAAALTDFIDQLPPAVAQALAALMYAGISWGPPSVADQSRILTLDPSAKQARSDIRRTTQRAAFIYRGVEQLPPNIPLSELPRRIAVGQQR